MTRQKRVRCTPLLIDFNLASSVGGKLQDWEVEEHILGVIMAQQYSVKKRTEFFGDKTKAATVKELT